MAACQTTPPYTNGQGGNPGPDSCVGNSADKITIAYKASSITVTPKVRVDKDTHFKVILKPDSSDAAVKNMNVYLFGNTADAAWLNKVYNADGNNQKEFDICADAPIGEYKYMVVIPGIGTIDPRIVVKNPD